GRDGGGYCKKIDKSQKKKGATERGRGNPLGSRKVGRKKGGGGGSGRGGKPPAGGPPTRRPIRQVTNSPRTPTAAPISRRVSNSVNGRSLTASAASRSKPPP